jgi:DNA-binding NtrC family response regulator
VLLQSVQAAAPQVSVIATGADINAARAIEWIRAGAADVLVKPFGGTDLAQAIARATSRSALERRSGATGAEPTARGPLEEVVGSDPQLGRALELARAASRVRSTVLIHGESGTGKSLLARAIHRASPRAAMPFVELACGSIPETLLESELFGHVKGAFTGAIADKKGRFLAADGGTLFLDEINSASPTMQLKLLRVLQERKFEAVGSDETIEVDVRVIVASNQPLERLVEEGRFRQDLFYRVHVLPIELPPLRARPSDVVALAEHFLRAKSAELGRTILGFTAAAGEAMRRYRWPGNVRELENAIERAAIMCDAAWLDDIHLPERVRNAEPRTEPQPMPLESRGSGEEPRGEHPVSETRVIPISNGIANGQARASQAGRTLADVMRDPERTALLAALTAHHWNRSKAAASLGINRTTLYRKMRDLGLTQLGEAG